MASDGRAEFDPKEIARAAFPTAFRGYDQEAVHRYLTRLAAAIGRAQQTGQLGSVDNNDNAAHLRAAEAEHEAAELRSRVEELEELLQTQAYEAQALEAQALEAQAELEAAAQAEAEIDNEAALDDSVDVDVVPNGRSLGESELIEQLGQETARIVEAARSAAADMAQRAEEEASLVKAEATLEARAQKTESEEALASALLEAEEITEKAKADAKKMEARFRADAKRTRENAKAKADKVVADASTRAEGDLVAARQRANQIVVDAEALREEILGDLVRRRRVNQEQLDRLTSARDRLAQALVGARNELDDVASEIHLAIPSAVLDLTEEEPTRHAADGDEVAELVSQLKGATAEVSNGIGVGDVEVSNDAGSNGRSESKVSSSGSTVNGSSSNGGGSYTNGNGHADALADYRSDVSPFEELLATEDTMQLGIITLDNPDVDVDVDVDQTLELGNGNGNGSDRLRDDPDLDAVDDGIAVVEDDANEADGVGQPEFDAGAESEEDDGEARDSDLEIEVEFVHAESDQTGELTEESIDTDTDIDIDTDPETEVAEAQEAFAFDGPIDGDRLLDNLGFSADPVLGSGSGDMHRSAMRGDLPRNVPFAGRLPAVFEGRDVALGRSTSGFRRRLKRAVNDDQSDVLDRLRAGRGTIGVDELPVLQDQLDTYVAALRPALTDVVTAGGEQLGSSEVPVPALDNLCLQLAKHIVDNLRLPTVGVIESSPDGDREAILDPVRAIYRDFRNTLLPDLIEDALHEAFALGLYHAIDAGDRVLWAVDPRLDPDPICEENSASSALAKGTDFPSGHARPLSMPGCRCLAIPAS